MCVPVYICEEKWTSEATPLLYSASSFHITIAVRNRCCHHHLNETMGGNLYQLRRAERSEQLRLKFACLLRLNASLCDLILLEFFSIGLVMIELLFHTVSHWSCTLPGTSKSYLGQL